MLVTGLGGVSAACQKWAKGERASEPRSAVTIGPLGGLKAKRIRLIAGQEMSRERWDRRRESERLPGSGAEGRGRIALHGR